MHGIGERENGKNPGVLLCMYFWGRAPSRRRALMTTKEDGSIESAMKSPSWMGVAAFGTNEKTDSYLVPAWWRDIGLWRKVLWLTYITYGSSCGSHHRVKV